MGESEQVEENAWNRAVRGRKMGKGGNEKLAGQLIDSSTTNGPTKTPNAGLAFFLYF